MYHILLIVLFIFSGQQIEAKLQVPYETHELPKDQFDDQLRKTTTELSEYADVKWDQETYKNLKKFMSACIYNQEKFFREDIFKNCYSKDTKIRTFDIRDKSVKDHGFEETIEYMKYSRDVGIVVHEKFLEDEPFWAYRIKDNPEWIVAFFVLDQINQKGTYYTVKVSLVRQKKKSFEIYRVSNKESYYDLRKSKPRSFLEVVAKAMGDAQTNRVLSMELTKAKHGFNYLFSEYAGDGLHERRGKLTKDGKLIEREMQYAYCSHSMGDQNKCYQATIKQTFDLKTNKPLTYEGFYQENWRKDKKLLVKIEIKGEKGLRKAIEFNESNKDQFRIYFDKPIPKDLLVPTKYCRSGEGQCG